MAEDDYNIGYRKPPLWNRFRPGQSGNPNGRPKKSKIALTILEQITKELEGLITIRENGRVIKVTKMQAAIKNLVANAMRGDPKSIALMMKTLPQLEEIGETKEVIVGVRWLRNDEEHEPDQRQLPSPD